jgi:hypothetical protein
MQMYNILFIGKASMPCFYPASESNKGQDGYDSNTHIKLVGNCCCKDQLPPSNINLLKHIFGVKKSSPSSVHLACVVWL